MRYLFRFIVRYSFFLLFLVFEGVSVYLLISSNNYQQAKFINSSNAVSGYLLQKASNIKQYLNLSVVNQQLAEENARLHNKLPDFSDTIQGNADTSSNKQYTYIQATVINNSVNRRNNFLTLNKGKLDGIGSEMAVFGPNGMVGIVKNVSDHYCSVISVLNPEVRFSVMVKKNNYYGSLFWDGLDFRFATLAEIPSHVNLSVGDSIITSGYSAIFPYGIPVGAIENVDLIEGKSFYKIKVRLFTDFKNLYHVFIVKNSLINEQKALEKQANYDQGSY